MTTDCLTPARTAHIYETPKAQSYWQQTKEWSNKAPSYSAIELWHKAIAYFDWAERSPLKEQKIFSNGTVIEMDKMRLLSENGFSLFADISMEQFATYLHDDDYEHTLLRIQNTIYTQNMEGAAAGLLHQKVVSMQEKTPQKVRPPVYAPRPSHIHHFFDNEKDAHDAYELEMKEKAEKRAAGEKASHEAQIREETEEAAPEVTTQAEQSAKATPSVEIQAIRNTGYRPKRDAKGRLLAREGRRY